MAKPKPTISRPPRAKKVWALVGRYGTIETDFIYDYHEKYAANRMAKELNGDADYFDRVKAPFRVILVNVSPANPDG